MMPGWSPFEGALFVAQPPAVDLREILTDLDDNSVAAPGDQDALATVVNEAASEHDLRLAVVVVTEADSSTELPELASQIQQERGGTVLVLSPNFVGARSDRYDSATVTAAVDGLPQDDVAATEEFVQRLTYSGPPWIAIVLIAAVLLAAVVAVGRWWERRRRQRKDAAALSAEGARLRAETAAMAEALLAIEPQVSLRDNGELSAEYDHVVVEYRDLTHAVERDPRTRRAAEKLTARVRALRERVDAMTNALKL